MSGSGMKSGGLQEKFQCGICNRTYLSKKLLVKHLHRHEKPPFFPCGECGKTFPTKTRLKIHNRIHTGERPYQCSHCSSSFASNFQLKLHGRTHTGEKPYTCSYCKKDFRSASGLRTHTQIHTEDHPYTCSQCNKRFRQKDKLRLHERIHSGAKPFMCDQCPRTFRLKNALVRHFRIHSGETYKCALCPKEFGELYALKKHHRRKHIEVSFPGPDAKQGDETTIPKVAVSHKDGQVLQKGKAYLEKNIQDSKVSQKENKTCNVFSESEMCKNEPTGPEIQTNKDCQKHGAPGSQKGNQIFQKQEGRLDHTNVSVNGVVNQAPSYCIDRTQTDDLRNHIFDDRQAETTPKVHYSYHGGQTVLRDGENCKGKKHSCQSQVCEPSVGSYIAKPGKQGGKVEKCQLKGKKNIKPRAERCNIEEKISSSIKDEISKLHHAAVDQRNSSIELEGSEWHRIPLPVNTGQPSRHVESDLQNQHQESPGLFMSRTQTGAQTTDLSVELNTNKEQHDIFVVARNSSQEDLAIQVRDHVLQTEDQHSSPADDIQYSPRIQDAGGSQTRNQCSGEDTDMMNTTYSGVHPSAMEYFAVAENSSSYRYAEGTHDHHFEKSYGPDFVPSENGPQLLNQNSHFYGTFPEANYDGAMHSTAFMDYHSQSYYPQQQHDIYQNHHQQMPQNKGDRCEVHQSDISTLAVDQAMPPASHHCHAHYPYQHYQHSHQHHLPHYFSTHHQDHQMCDNEHSGENVSIQRNIGPHIENSGTSNMIHHFDAGFQDPSDGFRKSLPSFSSLARPDYSCFTDEPDPVFLNRSSRKSVLTSHATNQQGSTIKGMKHVEPKHISDLQPASNCTSQLHTDTSHSGSSEIHHKGAPDLVAHIHHSRTENSQAGWQEDFQSQNNQQAVVSHSSFNLRHNVQARPTLKSKTFENSVSGPQNNHHHHSSLSGKHLTQEDRVYYQSFVTSSAPLSDNYIEQTSSVPVLSKPSCHFHGPLSPEENSKHNSFPNNQLQISQDDASWNTGCERNSLVNFLSQNEGLPESHHFKPMTELDTEMAHESMHRDKSETMASYLCQKPGIVSVPSDFIPQSMASSCRDSKSLPDPRFEDLTGPSHSRTDVTVLTNQRSEDCIVSRHLRSEGITVPPNLRMIESANSPHPRSEDITMSPDLKTGNVLVSPHLRHEGIKSITVSSDMRLADVTISPHLRSEGITISPDMRTSDVTVSPYLRSEDITVSPNMSTRDLAASQSLRSELITVLPNMRNGDITVLPHFRSELITELPPPHRNSEDVIMSSNIRSENTAVLSRLRSVDIKVSSSITCNNADLLANPVHGKTSQTQDSEALTDRHKPPAQDVNGSDISQHNASSYNKNIHDEKTMKTDNKNTFKQEQRNQTCEKSSEFQNIQLKDKDSELTSNKVSVHKEAAVIIGISKRPKRTLCASRYRNVSNRPSASAGNGNIKSTVLLNQNVLSSSEKVHQAEIIDKGACLYLYSDKSKKVSEIHIANPSSQNVKTDVKNAKVQKQKPTETNTERNETASDKYSTVSAMSDKKGKLFPDNGSNELTKLQLSELKNAQLQCVKKNSLIDLKRNLFQCLVCGKKFKQKTQLSYHIISLHYDGPKLTCFHCGKQFPHKGRYEHHIKTHLSKQFPCTKCERAFTEKKYLANHMKSHEKPRKGFICDSCGKAFLRHHQLTVHYRTHTGEKPYKCSYCPAQFATSFQLGLHERLHTGARPYKCPHCSKCFRSRMNLVTHVRRHNNDKPYICSSCGAAFVEPSKLKNHMRLHTGLQPYACDQCSKAFTVRHLLVRHKRWHTGDTYDCSCCDMTFIEKYRLKNHMKKHHPDVKIS